MARIEARAYAKLNLSLDVLSARPDGYHDLRMVMHTVELCDRLTLELPTGGPLLVTSNLGYLPTGERNLAAAAALRLCERMGAELKGLTITLNKRIPVCAGLGGGSADAAAVLRALNQGLRLGLTGPELAQIGNEIGSDVPFCVLGGAALAEGRGELLTQLPPLPACFAVLCKPGFAVSTPELFDRIDCGKIRCRPDTGGLIDCMQARDLCGVARRMYNVFEDVLPERRGAEIAEIKNTLIQLGAIGASMSGTGPTVFGLFSDELAAQRASAVLRESYQDVFLTRTRSVPEQIG